MSSNSLSASFDIFFFNLVNYIDKFPNGELTLKSWDKLCLVTCSVLVARLCLTLCDPMDCSPPGSSVHGILQARILAWVAIPFSRGSYQTRDWICVSCIAGRFSTVWATRTVHNVLFNILLDSIFITLLFLQTHLISLNFSYTLLSQTVAFT